MVYNPSQSLRVNHFESITSSQSLRVIIYSSRKYSRQELAQMTGLSVSALKCRLHGILTMKGRRLTINEVVQCLEQMSIPYQLKLT